MTMHRHHLRGCAPAPLAHYLKALGILRLVAEQADPGARLWWQDEHAWLATRLDLEALLTFLADQAAPTPMVAPWNGGSGFYPKDNPAGVSGVMAITHPRFAPYQAAIRWCQAACAGREESPKQDDKAALIARCRREWRDGLARWLAAAIVLDDELEPSYPALLGTGGNDGRLDFTNNLMQRWTELVDSAGIATPAARRLLRAAVIGDPAPGLMSGKAIGQFLPGGAGGANGTTGFDADSLLNPWDFVLMLEGAVVWTAAASRRLTTDEVSMTSAPFALRAQPSGHGTASLQEDAPRGEQWLPLWAQPASCPEVLAMLAEGRIATTNGPAKRPSEAARAIARLGAARGITAFERVGYLERNGQANLAIPLGRWVVPSTTRPHLDLVDEAAAWIERFSRAARDEHAPQSWKAAGRRCAEAVLACCRKDDPWERMELLLAMGAAEAVLARIPHRAAEAQVPPLPEPKGDWLAALPTSESQELRLACAIASQSAELKLRRHWLTPVDARWFAFAERSDVDVAVGSGDFHREAAAILRRRLRAGPYPFRPHPRHAASLTDWLDLVNGKINTTLMWSLVRPLLSVDWDAVPTPAEPSHDAEQQRADLRAAAIAGVIRLVHADVRLPGAETTIAVDPSIFATLMAGHADRATQQALHRLRIVGLRPLISATVAASSEAAHLAACLIVPLAAESLRTLCRTLCVCPSRTAEPTA